MKYPTEAIIIAKRIYPAPPICKLATSLNPSYIIVVGKVKRNPQDSISPNLTLPFKIKPIINKTRLITAKTTPPLTQ